MDYATSSPIRADQVVFSFGPDGLVGLAPDYPPTVETSPITLRSADSRISLLVNDRFAVVHDVAIFEWGEYLIKGTGLVNIRLPGATVDKLDDNLYRFLDEMNLNDVATLVEAYPDYRDQLEALKALLVEYDLHFGYRVFDEIMQFMAVAEMGDLFTDFG